MHSFAWSDLQFILAVSRSGSLSGAARELGVNHATVLRRVQAFETRHGLRLFERAPGGYRPMADHVPLIADLTVIGDLIGKFERRLAGQGEAFEGTLRLTTTDTFSRTLLPRHLAGFLTAFPKMRLDMMVTNERLDLARLDADLTVRPAQALPEGLVGERVGDLAFQVYGHKDLADIATSELSWIAPGGTLSGSPVGGWMAEYVPDADVVMKLNSFAAVLDAVAAGVGIALLPCCLADQSADLRRRHMAHTPLLTGVWVAAHEDMAQSSRIQAVLNYLSAALAKDRAVLAGRSPDLETGLADPVTRRAAQAPDQAAPPEPKDRG